MSATRTYARFLKGYQYGPKPGFVTHWGGCPRDPTPRDPTPSARTPARGGTTTRALPAYAFARKKLAPVRVFQPRPRLRGPACALVARQRRPHYIAVLPPRGASAT